MCSPRIIEHVQQTLSQSDHFKLSASPAGTAVLPAPSSRAHPHRTRTLGFERVQDLTHTLSPSFPLYPGFEPMKITKQYALESDGFYANRWDLLEHCGTHMDAPAHFVAGGVTADLLEVSSLLAPLAVIDIRARAAENADAALTVDDLIAWEEQHGPLPPRAAVFMLSGWDERIGDGAAFLNADTEGTLHCPGFSPDAAAFLVYERQVVGIGVDTISVDLGTSTNFDVHVTVAEAGVWGLENLANLGNLPPSGATVIVGVPKVEGASGGPTRVLAAWS